MIHKYININLFELTKEAVTLQNICKICNINEVEELNYIIESGSISTVFQPIVSLLDGSVLGYEALSRGPSQSPLQSPDKLFKAAEDCNKTWELELLCRTKAIERAANLSR